MGSPLGPILADIFMGKLEGRCLSETIKQTYFYRRYVDDIFVILESEKALSTINETFNKAHPKISFTFETEADNAFHFLDVKLERGLDGMLTRSVYRKETLQFRLHTAETQSD